MTKSATSSKRRIALPWRGLIWQLFIVTFLPLSVLVMVIAFGSTIIHQRAMRTLVGERDELAVKTAAASLEEQLKHREDSLRSLARLVDTAQPDQPGEILSRSDYLRSDFDAGLAVYGADGSLKYSQGDQVFWNGLAGRIIPEIQNLLANEDHPAVISTTFADPATGKRMVLVLAVSPDSKRIVAGASSAAGLVSHTLASAFANGPETATIVVDANKNILYEAGSFSSAGNATAHPGIAKALRGMSGTLYVPVGHSEHVVAYSPVAPFGWALVLEEDWRTVTSPTLDISQIAPLALIPALLLMLVAIWFGLRQVVQPLQALESKAAMLAWGNFSAIEEPVGGIQEIRHLQAELTNMANKVQAAQRSLHGYIGAITAAQEDERRRMARELHDDTIQSLIALKQRVQLAQLALSEAPGTSSFNEIASLTEQTIENLRRLTRALRPIYLEDLGLVAALEMLAQETGQVTGATIEFQQQGKERRLSPEIELALYRMTQEALNNVVRHAQASHTYLNIFFGPAVITVQVKDDGKGFEVPKSPAEFAPSGHFGLLGLHERAELIGAKLEIISSPGRGTTLAITLPVSP